MAMATTEIGVDVIHDNSLDNSADSEYLGMVDEESFVTEGKPQLISQSVLNPNDSDYYNYKEIPNTVTYKLISMPSEDVCLSNMGSHSPSHEYYVISNPVEVLGTGVTTNTPKKPRVRKHIQPKAVGTKKRDDRRRATHNEVERRRRDKINNWITKLGALVPRSGHPDNASKGGILAKACDYITDMRERNKKLMKVEMENRKLVLEVLQLKEELAEVRKENNSMRLKMGVTSIMVTRRSKGQKS